MTHWPPLREGHPAVGMICPGCGVVLEVGDRPGMHDGVPDTPEDEERAAQGLPHTKRGLVGHADCSAALGARA